MNTRNILFTIALLTLLMGLAMAVTLLVAIRAGDPADAIHGLKTSASVTLALSMAGMLISRKWCKTPPGHAHSALREAFLTICCFWLGAMILGSLPFILCCHFTPADAVFETASGLSTTGGSVITPGMRLLKGQTLALGLEGLPKAILFWRALLNWLGGIGFVMFALLILPALGGGKQLYNAEVPGLKSIYDQATPRIASTARLTILCYLLWTATVVLAFRYCGMGNYFDAVCHAFATVATGGFGNYSDSFAHFPSPLLQWVAIAAMFLSSCNLMLMAELLLHGKCSYHRDEETRAFFFLTAGVALIFTCQLFFGRREISYLDGTAVPRTWWACLRASAFQVVSLISTTGYATSDYLAWKLPGLPGMLLLIMFCGGCGGSTAGGLKIARVLVIAKQARGEVRRRIFPHLMPNVMLNHTRIDMSVVRQSMAFLGIYVAVITFCTLLLPYLTPMDLETAFSSAVSAISNVGPGLGKIGPACSYNWMSPAAKFLLSFTMIAGRLELYTALVVLLPSFWLKRN